MKSLRKFVSLVLTICLVSTQTIALAEEATPTTAFYNKVESFIQDYNSKPFLALLNNDELIKSLQANSLNLMMLEISQKASRNLDGPGEPKNLVEWSELQAQFDKRALFLTKELFEMDVANINSAILTLFHRFLFDDSARPAVETIMTQIANYKFSLEEEYRLKKQDSWQAQAVPGTYLSLGLVAAIILYKGRKVFSMATWNAMKDRLSRVRAKDSGAVAVKAEQAAKSGLEQGEMTYEEMLKWMERTGLAKAAPASAEISSGSTVSRINKIRYLKKIANIIIDPQSIRWMLGMTGVVVAGSASSVGLYRLAKILRPNSPDDGLMAFTELKTNHFDKLASLRLLCQSSDLNTRVASVKTGPFLKWMLEINKLYSEFELLKRMRPDLIETTALPESVKFDSKTGRVTYTIPSTPANITDGFDCPRLINQPAGPIYTSLGMSNNVLLSAADHLSKIQAAQKPSPEDMK